MNYKGIKLSYREKEELVMIAIDKYKELCKTRKSIEEDNDNAVLNIELLLANQIRAISGE